LAQVYTPMAAVISMTPAFQSVGGASTQSGGEDDLEGRLIDAQNAVLAKNRRHICFCIGGFGVGVAIFLVFLLVFFEVIDNYAPTASVKLETFKSGGITVNRDEVFSLPVAVVGDAEWVRCRSVDPRVTTAWCDINCNHEPPNCPDWGCACADGPVPAPTPSPPPSPPGKEGTLTLLAFVDIAVDNPNSFDATLTSATAAVWYLEPSDLSFPPPTPPPPPDPPWARRRRTTTPTTTPAPGPPTYTLMGSVQIPEGVSLSSKGTTSVPLQMKFVNMKENERMLNSLKRSCDGGQVGLKFQIENIKVSVNFRETQIADLEFTEKVKVICKR